MGSTELVPASLARRTQVSISMLVPRLVWLLPRRSPVRRPCCSWWHLILLTVVTISEAKFQKYCLACQAIPDSLAAWLPALDIQCKGIAKYFRLATNSLFTGSGVHFPVALEGALKLKEISYIHAEGFPGTELKHHGMTLVERFLPVFIIALKSSPAYTGIKDSVLELKERRAAIIVLTEDGNSDFDGIASFVIHCPATEPLLEPLITVIPMQLLSYYIAQMRGCEIDQPRNLAKSVTVE